jgi:hypothetical protein
MKKILIILMVVTYFLLPTSFSQDSTVTSFTKVTTIDSAGAFYIVQGAADRHVIWDQMVDAVVDSFENGIIVNGMISTGAAIALTKLAHGTAAYFIVNNGSGVPTYVTMSGDATLSNAGAVTIAANAIGSSEITDGSITTNDISDGTITSTDIYSGAQIQATQLETALDGQIIVSTTPGVPDWVTVSGDATITNAGVVDLADALTDNFTLSGNLVFTGKHSYPTTTSDQQWQTGAVTLDLANVDSRFFLVDVGQTSGMIISDIANGVDGQLITIMADGDAQETFDIDNGTEIALSGAVDLTAMDQWSSVTLVYILAVDLWVEVSRCVR